MNKELEYEVNNFANLLNKDCMNLMECLKKQGEDNKPILYLGKHYEKVILPLKEYQKMYKRLEQIDNAEPSEALKCLNCLERLHDCGVFNYEEMEDYNIIKNYILKAQEPKQYVDELKLVEKKLKALEIIKEKNVDIDYFLFWSKQGNLGKVEDYNHLLKHKNGRYQRLLLTEEEFNILKAALEC